jgi:hypothetical protein
MVRKAVLIALIIVAGLVALVTIRPMAPATPYAAPMADGAVQPTTYTPMATPTYSLPLCENEDGSGQPLCVWDATYQGDGEGNTIIAGDCSVDTVGDKATSDMCLKAYASHNGAERVDECLTIEWEISTGEAKRENGWTLAECFKVMAQ